MRGGEIDILLVAVGSPDRAAAKAARLIGIPPMGIAYLAAVLRRAGISARLIDLNVPGWSRERFEKCLALQRPRIVGLSCTTESFRNAIRLARFIRDRRPEAIVLAGGPHVTFEDGPALRTGVFHLVVRGEAEGIVQDLVPALLSGRGPSPSIPGISYADGGRIVRTGDRQRIEELDSLPHPARDLLFLERYGSPGALLAGRGCPSRCCFCSAGAMSGGRYRVRSPEGVLDEIESLFRLGLREINFLDDTLTGDPERLERLLDGIERRRLRFTWTCESRLDAVDRSLLRRMARLGCHAIQFGIESGSAASRLQAGKGRGSRRIDPILRATDRAGITPICTFILGLPWEDAATVRGTIELALDLQKRYLAKVSFGILVCYPGTLLWRRSAAFGLRRVTGDFDRYRMHEPTCDTYRLGTEELRALYFEATVRLLKELPPALIELSPDLAGWSRTAREW